MKDELLETGEGTPAIKKYTKIYILPSLFTAGNLFFGFLAIIRCIQAKYGTSTGFAPDYYYTQAVWCILFAFICDALDGRVARLGGQESLFGKEFDSIADVVSFGVAPSLMMFFLLLSPTEGYPFIRQIGWLIGFIYLLCSGVRLARFNVLTHPLLPESEKQVDQSQFVGLPVPAAAALTASLVLVLTDINLKWLWLAMPALMLLISCLMVSTIPYPSFKNIDWNTETRFRTFVVMIGGLAALFFLFREYAFAIIFLGYIFYGLFRYVNGKFRVNVKIPGKYS